MPEQPLAHPPSDSPVLALFARHFRIDTSGEPEGTLLAAASAFASIPYENLTKILKEAAGGGPERARRGPLEVVSDHVALGAGGTCFSLSAALLHLVRALGWRAEPILADRNYGPDTHCALLVWIGSIPHLLDPGYLIVRPIPLDGREEVRLRTEFNEVILVPRENGARVELHTIEEGRRKHRLTFRAEPADPGAFLRAWDASFGWDMMRYPLLTRAGGGKQLYLQGNRLQVRERGTLERSEIDPAELAGRIQAAFGIDPHIARRALEVLRRKGETHGASRCT